MELRLGHRLGPAAAAFLTAGAIAGLLARDGAGDASVEPSLSVNGGISVVATGKSGILYFAGNFARVRPNAGSRRLVRHGVAAVDVRTGIVTRWNPNPNGEVGALALGPSSRVVYAVGDFNRIGGKRRLKVVALDPHTGAATAWSAPRLHGALWALAVSLDEKRVYVAGDSGVVAIDAGTGRQLWKALRLADTLELSADGTTVFATGSYAGQGVVAALRARDGKIIWTAPGAYGIRALLASPDGRTLYFGGALDPVTTFWRDLGALDARTGQRIRWAPKLSGNQAGLDEDRGVYALAYSRRTHAVYVGGAFTAIGGAPRVGLGAVDAKTARPLSWNPGMDDLVCTLGLSPNSSTLYFGTRCNGSLGKVRGVTAAPAR